MAGFSYPKPSLLYGVLAASVAVNLFVVLRHPATAPVAPAAVDTAAAPAAPAAATQAPAQAGAVFATAGQVPAADKAAPAANSSSGQWTTVSAKVEQSLARTFQVAAGEDGDALVSVFTRIFVWDLDVRRDILAGDSVSVVWRKGGDGLPEIAAASLQSRHLGRTLTAYRWQAPGDPFPSYWHPDGSEAPLRLKDGPLLQYEQITSLLKDRPTHKGMDFKTPLGSEVHAPKAGTVTRINWNWTMNGNCIEIRYEDGMLAKFLHLSANKVSEGQKVSAGQIIALTGNTGHTTAPHLHYQLNRDENHVIDPLDYHGTVRRVLAADQVATMKRDVAEYDKMLAGGSNG
ncbi:MAG TPA: M23 family metallopeptidase [Candidatus Binatia bacterium]|jgi:murein DD-endopeptidase MepM/ murein hydrolase activator NlpD